MAVRLALSSGSRLRPTCAMAIDRAVRAQRRHRRAALLDQHLEGAVVGHLAAHAQLTAEGPALGEGLAVLGITHRGGLKPGKAIVVHQAGGQLGGYRQAPQEQHPAQQGTEKAAHRHLVPPGMTALTERFVASRANSCRASSDRLSPGSNPGPLADRSRPGAGRIAAPATVRSQGWRRGDRLSARRLKET